MVSHMFLRIAFFLLWLILFSGCSRQPLYPSPEVRDDSVVIKKGILTEKKPVFFSYHYNKRRINFFVIKINGKVSSYLDACAACYPKRLGFGFEEGYIYCRSCNVRYPIDDIEKGLGSCYPIKVAGEEREEEYLIPLENLRKQVNKF